MAPSVPSLDDYFERICKYFRTLSITVYNPVEFLGTTKTEAEAVRNLLMDTFELLMSSISVNQASRTTVLTYLAILYLPMTVTTGIFGMNISEINGGTPNFWAVISVTFGLVLLTIPVYFLLRMFDNRSK